MFSVTFSYDDDQGRLARLASTLDAHYRRNREEVTVSPAEVFSPIPPHEMFRIDMTDAR